MWDLHVHTPDSIVQDYSGPQGERWDRFLTELESLPSDIRVLGINDYWFLDGYRRVREAQESGRLANLEEIFPVIEVRCDTFSGTEGALKRVNLHAILDPAVPVDDLDTQLRSILRPSYQLTPSNQPDPWHETVTRESMARLGQRVMDATPERKKTEYSHKSPLEVGFYNLNVSFEEFRAGVQANSLLRDHVILALGKVEWDSIKWSLGSIAQKKHLVNSAHALFTASMTRRAFDKSLASLKAAEVRHRLLDCSDAHHWVDSDSHMRLGNCFTWLNADPTFKGLRQALQEYDHRVTTDERPAVLTRVAHFPRSVITDVTLSHTGAQTETAPLFDSSMPLNPGFVVVIGNKGQGKSALLDSIALAANSDRQEDFSFLTAKRFRMVGSPAADYTVSITWADGTKAEARMDQGFAPGVPIRVDYLPQSLIEKVCSADPNSVTKQDFESEIERVVFRHIDDEKRGSSTSLRQLLEEQGLDHQATLTSARGRIASAAADLAALRRRQGELISLQLADRETVLLERVAEVEAALRSVTAEIESGGTSEQQEQATALRAARDKRQEVETAILAVRTDREAIIADVEEVSTLWSRLGESMSQAQATAETLAARLGVRSDAMLEVTLNEGLVTTWQESRMAEAAALLTTREQAGGLNDQLAVANLAVQEQESVLQQINEGTQSLLQQQADLRAQVDHLRGEPGEPETLRGVEALKEELERIPAAVTDAISELQTAFREAHAALIAIKALQKEAYEPATQFVESNRLAKDVDLAFGVEFRVRDFVDRWIAMVNRQRLGQFHDVARVDRDEQILAGVDLDDSESLLASLDSIVDRLGRDGGSKTGDTRSLNDIMRSGHSPADLLAAIYGLDWLHSQYIIRAEESELSELSPGQRGLVLLLFYLLVDKSERPLLLDQPEENLDNQTVRNVLVPALREAVQRRQVIAVTHNPNFAVVGDADQIIVAEFNGHFSYRSGSIAEFEVGQSAIDVLEGTREAFAWRNDTYTDVVGT